MQVNGIGSGWEPHSHTHTVSQCVHEEEAAKKKSGSAAAPKASQAVESQADPQSFDGGFSFFEWAQKFFKNTKKLLGRIWGTDGSHPGTDSGNSVRAYGSLIDKNLPLGLPDRETERRMADMAAQNLMPGRSRAETDDPVSSPGKSTGEAGTLNRRLRYKIQALTKNLAERFGFAGRQNFRSGTGRQQEEMQRRRTYTPNGVKIDSMQPLDSHLLDSYDKKGEYSKISTKR